MSAKYFVDISEAVAKGITLDQITVQSTTNGGAKVSQLLPWDPDNHIYYVNIDFTGINIFPGGINEYKRDVYFTITAPYGEGNWDNTNDFSFQGLEQGFTSKKTEYIPLYDGNVRVWGKVPDGGSEPDPTPTITVGPTPSVTPTSVPGIMLGDVNFDGRINSTDYSRLKRYVIKSLEFTDPEEHQKFIAAADVDGNGRINSTDLYVLNRYILKLIEKFPAEQ